MKIGKNKLPNLKNLHYPNLYSWKHYVELTLL